MKHWRDVRNELARPPTVEGDIGGDYPLHVERYVNRSLERTVPGLRTVLLITHFGGARIREGEIGHWRATTLASQCLLLPPDCPTHWYYSSTVDFALFCFPERPSGIMERLRELAVVRRDPQAFGDHLVSASALELVNELERGTDADDAFMARVAAVMLEQTYRALTSLAKGGPDPRHMHALRLQAVLAYVREHLAEDLSAQALADRTRLSLAQFRRLFRDAMGMPPHRYVLAARLAQARKLLAMTEMPIADIAENCGFSSQSHLTTSFRTAHDATPAEFRAGIALRTPG